MKANEFMEFLNRLLEISVYSIVLFLIIFSVKKIFKNKMSPVLHFAIWFILIARFCLPFTIDSGLRFFTIPAAPPLQITPISSQADSYTGSSTIQSSTNIQSPDSQTGSDRTDPASINQGSNGALQKSNPFSLTLLLIVLWILGMVLQILRMAVSAVKMNRIIYKQGRVPDGHIINIFEACKSEMNIKKKIPVIILSNITTPALIIGFLPKLMLPKDMMRTLSDEQVRYAITHELMHFKRKDNLLSLLLRVLEAVHWFNPVVWIMNRCIIADMETACDSMVVRALGKREKKQYVLTLIEMFSQKKTPQFLLGMALYNSEKIAEERIRGVYMKNKSRLGVKAIAAVLAVVMFVCCFTTACQPTPAKPIVINKNTDLVKTVVSANSTDNQADLKNEKQTIQDQINAVGGHMKMQMKPNPRVTINVDADIISPGFDKLPLVRVKPINFSKEQFEKFTNYITGGQTLYYETFDQKTGNTFSKEEIAAILTRIKGFLNNKDLPIYIKNSWKQMVKELEDSYDTAINKEDEKPYDGTLIEEKDNSTFNSITYLKCYMGKTRAAMLSLWQSFDGNETQITFNNNDYGSGFNTFEPYEGVDAPRVKMTYEEAKKKAQDFVRAMDGDGSNLEIYDSDISFELGTVANYTKETSPQAYAFNFARSYNGIKVRPVNHLDGSGENVDYSKVVAPESILMIIDNDGINTVYWNNYTQYIETVTDDTPLMDFNSIQSIFEQYCKEKFTWVPHDDSFPDDLTVALNVKKVELNLMAVPEKDNLNNYITVPVWDFIADEKFDRELKEQDGYPYPAQENISIITINAVNGTIINREQGY